MKRYGDGRSPYNIDGMPPTHPSSKSSPTLYAVGCECDTRVHLAFGTPDGAAPRTHTIALCGCTVTPSTSPGSRVRHHACRACVADALRNGLTYAQENRALVTSNDSPARARSSLARAQAGT
jgi:hypothetical protein